MGKEGYMVNKNGESLTLFENGQQQLNQLNRLQRWDPGQVPATQEGTWGLRGVMHKLKATTKVTLR